MSESSEEEPKLIIDEDWKTQVQREKEQLRHAGDESPGDAPAGEDAGSESSTSSAATESQPDLPPASLTLLITTLVTQAMASLGQVPGDDGQPLPVNLPYAKHFIDLLGVLEEKTQGNLTEDEAVYLGDTLHQLRMFFVSVRKSQT